MLVTKSPTALTSPSFTARVCIMPASVLGVVVVVVKPATVVVDLPSVT